MVHRTLVLMTIDKMRTYIEDVYCMGTAGLPTIVYREVDWLSTSGRSDIGIHVTRPNERELLDAIERAERDLFPAVYVYL